MRVVRHRPGQRLLLGALIVLGGAVSGWVGYWWGTTDARDAGATIERLSGERIALAAKLQELEAAAERYRLASSVDSQAGETLRQTVGELEGRVSELSEEVRFYKRLMAPSELERGLQIAELTLEETMEPDELAYDLLLTQAARRRDWVQGKVNVDVLGKRQKEDVVLSLTDLADVDGYPLKFRFRYFQDFTGKIRLPDDFTPVSVVVTAVRDNGKDIQRTFQWRQIRG